MTDRAEIERLLQMTGRTLEGVTKVEIGYGSRRNGKTMSIIKHQSDVIELLVGALRDALQERDAALAKVPKWISVQEQSEPPKDGEYWCFGYWIGSGRKHAETAEYLCGEWKIVNNFVLTHWMPKPEPPEEEG